MGKQSSDDQPERLVTLVGLAGLVWHTNTQDKTMFVGQLLCYPNRD